MLLATLALLAMPAARAGMAAEAGPEPGEENIFPFRQYTLEELMAVEVRAPTKIDQPVREAPTVGALITREEMEGYGWQTLAEVLLRQTGFSPSQDFERITLSSRGQYESWNNNHLRLLVDGVPINNVSNGTAFVWEMLPLSMVRTIEVMRGPGSALYGSNATNGVIAINTREPSDQGDWQARVSLGNAGTRDCHFSGGRALPWVRALAAYKYQETEGNVYDSYDASRRTGPDGLRRKFRIDDDNASHSGFLKLDGRGPLEGLSLQTHLAWWRFATAQGWGHMVPDAPERAHNDREIVSLGYRSPALLDERLRIELVADCQRTAKEYDIKLRHDGYVSPGGTAFPGGIVERLETESLDYFTRAQADYRLAGDARLLFGVENLVYFSLGNDVHASNVDLNRGGTGLPFSDGAMHDLRPTNESLGSNPVENMGLYAQLSTGRLFDGRVSATLGSRYDFQYVEYLDIDAPDRAVTEKYLDQFSPRLGLVFFPHPDLTLKALAERAFRAPAISELFSINSYLGFSKPGPLQPENMTAFTLAADYSPFRHLSLRTDWFYQDFENQIAYSGSRNATSNIYSRTMTGFETEVRVDAAPGGAWSLTSFLNHTWAHQLDETVLEPGIARSDDLTWAPETVANLGAILARHGLSVSIQGHFQGRVYRRRSDILTAAGSPSDFSAYRPESLDPWVTVDGMVAYRFDNGLHLRVRGANLLDQEGYLMKPGNYPFDYRIQGARVLASVEYAFGASGSAAGPAPEKRPGI
jgi:outer membrane receptor protein involved in Fe transport